MIDKQPQQLDQLLMNEWNNKYTSRIQMFRSNLQCVLQKEIKDSPFYAYYNQSLIDNKRQSQFVSQTENPQLDSLIQDYNKDAFNFTLVEQDEILLYVDTDGLQVQRNKVVVEDLKQHEHPLILNSSPICKFHSIWPLFVNQQLPQVLSGDLVQCALNLFLLSENATLRLGYNGVGAHSSVNHFHFQTLYCEHLIPDFQMLPIERFPKQTLFTTEKVNDQQVMVSRVQGYPLNAFCLQVTPTPVYSDEVAKAYSYLAEVCQVFIELCLDHHIAHNLMISDRGLSIYIYPRQWQDSNQPHIRAAWLEFSGFAILRDKESYEKVTADWFDQHLRDCCSLVEDQFLSLGREAEEKLQQH